MHILYTLTPTHTYPHISPNSHDLEFYFCVYTLIPVQHLKQKRQCRHCVKSQRNKQLPWGTGDEVSIIITAEWMFPKEPGGVWVDSVDCESNSVRDEKAHNRSISSIPPSQNTQLGFSVSTGRWCKRKWPSTSDWNQWQLRTEKITFKNVYYINDLILSRYVTVTRSKLGQKVESKMWKELKQSKKTCEGNAYKMTLTRGGRRWRKERRAWKKCYLKRPGCLIKVIKTAGLICFCSA